MSSSEEVLLRSRCFCLPPFDCFGCCFFLSLPSSLVGERASVALASLMAEEEAMLRRRCCGWVERCSCHRGRISVDNWECIVVLGLIR